MASIMQNIIGGAAGGATVSIIVKAVDQYSQVLNKAKTDAAGMAQSFDASSAVVKAALFGAAGAVAGFLKSSYDLAAQEERVNISLRTTFKDTSVQVIAASRAMADRLVLDTTTVKQAYNILGNATKLSFGQQKDIMEAAADAAAATGQTITEVASSFARAIKTGQGRTLTMFGIDIEGLKGQSAIAQAIIDQMKEKHGDAAENVADSWTSAWTTIARNFREDVMQPVGDMMGELIKKSSNAADLVRLAWKYQGGELKISDQDYEQLTNMLLAGQDPKEIRQYMEDSQLRAAGADPNKLRDIAARRAQVQKELRLQAEKEIGGKGEGRVKSNLLDIAGRLATVENKITKEKAKAHSDEELLVELEKERLQLAEFRTGLEGSEALLFEAHLQNVQKELQANYSSVGVSVTANDLLLARTSITEELAKQTQKFYEQLLENHQEELGFVTNIAGQNERSATAMERQASAAERIADAQNRKSGSSKGSRGQRTVDDLFNSAVSDKPTASAMSIATKLALKFGGVPGFQTGGLVLSPSIAQVHPGEAIVPFSNARGGLGGITINVQGFIGDEIQFARKVGMALQQEVRAKAFI